MNVECFDYIEFEIDGELVTGHVEHVLHSVKGVEAWYKLRSTSLISSPKFVKFKDIHNVVATKGNKIKFEEMLPKYKNGLEGELYE